MLLLFHASDMVCEKNALTVHDFDKDPLNLIVENDRIYAAGTTLGSSTDCGSSAMKACGGLLANQTMVDDITTT